MVWPLRSCIFSLLVLNLLSPAPAAAAAEPPILTCSAEGTALTLWATPSRGGGLAALTAKIGKLPGQAEVSLRGARVVRGQGAWLLRGKDGPKGAAGEGGIILDLRSKEQVVYFAGQRFSGCQLRGGAAGESMLQAAAAAPPCTAERVRREHLAQVEGFGEPEGQTRIATELCEEQRRTTAARAAYEGALLAFVLAGMEEASSTSVWESAPSVLPHGDRLASECQAMERAIHTPHGLATLFFADRVAQLCYERLAQAFTPPPRKRE